MKPMPTVFSMILQVQHSPNKEGNGRAEWELLSMSNSSLPESTDLLNLEGYIHRPCPRGALLRP